MRARIDSACAGFLLTNAASYLIALGAMLFGSNSYLRVGWAGAILGALISFPAGIYLLVGGRHSRLLAAITCLFFAASSLHTFSIVKSHGFPPPWSDLFSPVPVCSLVCLVFLFFPRDEQKA